MLLEYLSVSRNTSSSIKVPKLAFSLISLSIHLFYPINDVGESASGGDGTSSVKRLINHPLQEILILWGVISKPKSSPFSQDPNNSQAHHTQNHEQQRELALFGIFPGK